MMKLTHDQVGLLTARLADAIKALSWTSEPIRIYPIPRGGIPVAYLLGSMMDGFVLTNDPAEADLFVDDIIDSGATMEEYCDKYPGRPFFALIDKLAPRSEYRDAWVVFPWENQDKSEDDSIVGTLTNRLRLVGVPFHANDNISAYLKPGELALLQEEVQRRAEYLLEGLLIDVENDHNTVGTAKRIAKMYLHEVFKGRYQPAPSVTDFPNAKGLDEMYMTGPITVRSACSHHFVPIVGRCWIGIVPGDRVIGLSKFNRIVEWIAARPQIQEELVMQIADYIEEQIQPKGLAVVVEATHLCMTWRGVKEPMEARMTTNVMRGSFRDKPEARAEFMALVTKG